MAQIVGYKNLDRLTIRLIACKGFKFQFKFVMATLGTFLEEEEEEDSEQQHSLRVGDTVLLYEKEVHGYIFSELSR